MNTCVLEGWLTPAECEAARALFPETSPGQLAAASAIARRSKTAFLPLDTDERIAFRKRVLDVMVQANREVYDFEIVGAERLQLAEYGVGDEYGWHTDAGHGAVTRKLSASVLVTDASEYDGGELELWGCKPIPKTQGTIVIFPAHVLHRVLPVTRGVRRSVVAWCVGSKPFR